MVFIFALAPTPFFDRQKIGNKVVVCDFGVFKFQNKGVIARYFPFPLA